ncbi:MAG: phosphate ABC transporter ATP-binding protein [Candidatus Omnitrophica bacterium]|nr:phosphate ABC transporter ATP-binding protein [Candidatus Omnitrophota bacterium]MBU1997141.1 phosphate ABC transporter ATP-binding protein [Candidatus Omnitrophota bacterium]
MSNVQGEKSRINVSTQKLCLYYGSFQALKEVNIEIIKNTITALIGPSGCGKSTLLRTFNRMNDMIEGVRTTGKVMITDTDIYSPGTDLVSLRTRVGMVFQRPNPFPFSIYENIFFGPKIHGSAKKKDYDKIIEESLRAVLLWDNLKDKLSRNALSLSLEQQQRLCIARLLPVKPEIILMDEPCSALDPIATERVEELMRTLKKEYTLIIVTHNMQQASRVSDYTGYMLLGELIEFSSTQNIFRNPKDKRTDDYITGRFG